jgi:uncharacterized membrane protein (UPF0127 family)
MAKDGKASEVVHVRNTRTQEVIGDRIQIAGTFWLKFRGLMGTSSLKEGEGMLFPSTNSIHMFFMHYPLLILYLSRDYRVMRVAIVAPWHIGPVVLRASMVMECPVSVSGRVQVGDVLAVER